MHGNINVKIWQILSLAVDSGETVSWFKVAAAWYKHTILYCIQISLAWSFLPSFLTPKSIM